MLKSYLTITLRNLRRHKLYALINVAGLALGIACALLILSYLRAELSYDRFHEKADRIYRVVFDMGIGGNVLQMALSPAPTAAALRAGFPEVEAATRILPGGATVRHGDRQYQEDRFFYADAAVFDVFTFPLLRGEARTALAEPGTVVLTEAAAKKYFGEDDPMGQTLEVGEGSTFTVTGVMEEVPSHAHFRFDFLASLADYDNQEWLSGKVYTYLVLQEGYPAEALQAKLPAFLKKYAGDAAAAALGVSYDEMLASGQAVYQASLQRLTDIHLHSSREWEIAPNSSITYVYVYAIVGLFILLIACINFMNLATARSAARAREVGVRKASGAVRGQLVGQFLAESMLMALLAALVAMVLADLMLPTFNAISGQTLSIDYAGDAYLLPALLGLALLVGLLAGSYPAFFLSSFRTAAVLKGSFQTSRRGIALRRGLVVVQFAISIFLIAGAAIVYEQLDYVQHKNLGFHKEQVVVLPLHQDATLQRRHTALKEALLQDPRILHAAAAVHYPGGPVAQVGYVPGDAPNDAMQQIWVLWAGYDYVETLDLEVIAGRAFSKTFATDAGEALLINETAAKKLGWDDPVGKQLDALGPDGRDREPGVVIGVVKDFHFESLHLPIRPLAIRLVDGPVYLLVRIRPDDMPGTLRFIEQQWQALSSGMPFTYSFLDEHFDALYRAEQRLASTFSVFSGLAIFIACLGLFGLATFTTAQRTKEIGVRKVLGASTPGLVVLLSRDFLQLVAVAIVVAVPAAYLAMRQWLDDFAYRIELGAGPFVLAGVLALVVALGVVSYQAVKSARRNPVESLRYE